MIEFEENTNIALENESIEFNRGIDHYQGNLEIKRCIKTACMFERIGFDGSFDWIIKLTFAVLVCT